MAVKDGKKVLGIVISVEDYDRLQKLAQKERRSVSNQGLILLLNALDQEEKRSK